MIDKSGQFVAELRENTKHVSAILTDAADTQNVRRLAHQFTENMRGHKQADVAAALIATAAGFIQHCGCETPGERLVIANVMLQEVVNALGRDQD